MRAALCFDAGPELGFGHAHRGLALGAALQAAGAKVDVLTRTPHALAGLHPAFPVTVLPDDGAPAVIQAARGVDVLVFDRLDPAEPLITAVRTGLEGAQLALIGNREPEGVSDLVIRQSVNSGPPRPGVLDGPEHLLLKANFLNLPARQPSDTVRRALVCLGGGRARGLTRLLAVLDEAAPPSLSHVHVIAEDAQSALPAAPRRRFLVQRRVDDMARLMAAVDLAIISGGGIVYEAAACGLPALYRPVVDHQVPLAAAAQRAGLGRLANETPKLDENVFAERLTALLADAETRAAMAHTGQTLVDGRGAQRVAEALLALRRKAQD